MNTSTSPLSKPPVSKPPIQKPIEPGIREKQLSASNPKSSAWVSANAGSGKTYVLVQRVVRLLLQGCEPSHILCLTFTKAAAGEMKNRVFAMLSEWTRLDDSELSTKLAYIESEEPDVTKLLMARKLFAKALETPGGLKVQTIHAFCESLLHKFPLEAGISSGFTVIDDMQQAALLAQAKKEIFTKISNGKNKNYNQLVNFANDSAIDEIINEFISRRETLEVWRKDIDGIENYEPTARNHLGFGKDDNIESLQKNLLQSLPMDKVEWENLMRCAKADEGKQSQELACKIDDYLNSRDDEARLLHLQKILFTQAGEVRSFTKYPAKSVCDSLPNIKDELATMANTLSVGLARIKTLRQIIATQYLFNFAMDIIESYRKLKQRAGKLDYDDLVARVVDLLKYQQASAWVLYKLDPGLEHILLDEAQDTNPRQWEIVNELTQEFFAGEGAQENSKRSLFVVGDEKQSIYSFQGVRSETFNEQLSNLKDKINLEQINLEQSFRSTQAVLEAVDAVFANEENATGLTNNKSELQHSAHRNDRGSVELWDLFPYVKPEKQNYWDSATAKDDDLTQKPAVLLAQNIADRIKKLIDEKYAINSKKEGVRPVHDGDFLILVQTRDEFFQAMVRELKNHNIAVSGEDRLVLSRYIAVQDLLALGRVIVTNDDDLSLAALLKSPLFNFSEDEIENLCVHRKGKSVWQALKISKEKKCAEAFAQLYEWQKWSQKYSIYEFYARVLGEGGGRSKFHARLGQESQDVLNSFLDMAINYSDSDLSGSFAGLANFIEDMSEETLEIKREWGEQQKQVRIMSVHGAKGLEAPIVFVVDKAGPKRSSSRARLHEWQNENQKLYLWSPSTSAEGDVSKQIKEKLKQESDAEYRRLLYVAMTRARDKLIVCGYQTGGGAGDETWHGMVHKTLSAELQRGEKLKGEKLANDIFIHHWRVREDELAKIKISKPQQPMANVLPLPNWFEKKLPPPADEIVPLNPSTAGAGVSGGEIDSVLNNKDSHLSFGRGLAVHKLLELLPNVQGEQRWQRAQKWLENNFSKSDSQSLLDSVRGILENESYKKYFAPETSRAEVRLSGVIEHGGKSRVVEGIVDRLVVLPDEVVVIDYKSNKHVPKSEADISGVYGGQMALYRVLLDSLYPRHKKRFVLLWTSGNPAKWMELSTDILNKHLDLLGESL